jgi:hypothetical protein
VVVTNGLANGAACKFKAVKDSTVIPPSGRVIRLRTCATQIDATINIYIELANLTKRLIVALATTDVNKFIDVPYTCQGDEGTRIVVAAPSGTPTVAFAELGASLL